MLKKLSLALIAASVALSACAAADNGANQAAAAAASSPTVASKAPVAAPAAAPAGQAGVADPAMEIVRQALVRFVPDVTIDSITPSKLPGYYQVIASGELVYVSTDGRYMMHGNLVDLGTKQSLSDDTWAQFRKAELAKVPASQRIVFAPPNPKYKVTVFTDVNCGYCRALHQQINAFNKAGIEVDYLAWPREGITTASGQETPTYAEMVSVWCAADRKAAFTAAKQDKAPKSATCANPVKDEFNLGARLGVTGTPAVIAPDGELVGGYVTPDQLLKLLQDQQAGS